MMSLLLAALDITIVATALPRIVADLGGLGQISWVLTADLIMSTTLVPIVGRASDIYGRKPTFIVGIVIFLVGSILSGVSQNMLQLVLSRGIQGGGAGFLLANTFTVIGDIFPPAERGKWQWTNWGCLRNSQYRRSVIGRLPHGSSELALDILCQLTRWTRCPFGSDNSHALFGRKEGILKYRLPRSCRPHPDPHSFTFGTLFSQ